MTFHLRGTILLLAAGLTGAVLPCMAQNGEAVDGRITNVTCETATLTRKGKSLSLSQRNVQMGVKASDVVACSGKGSVEIFLPDRTEIVTAKDPPFIVPSFPDNPQYPEIAKYMTSYGIAGATRGNAAQSRILWPADGSAEVPENFVVRWAPVSQKIAVSILTEAKDVTVWGPTDVDGSAGVLKSAGASSALAAYKRKLPNARLVLTITFGNENDWEEAHFSFLSAQQEQDLNGQLDFWTKHTDGLTLHLGRGYAYTRHKLFSEAADEYETALESAPESPYLLKDAIEADQRAGRASRVKELQSRLASLPPAANP